MNYAHSLTADELHALDMYWRAANYLGVAQIYLRDNYLLEAPLKAEHIKPRLLGHWGTVPGINFIYAHLNRLVRQSEQSMLLVTGPGHGAPANLANLLPRRHPRRCSSRAMLHRVHSPISGHSKRFIAESGRATTQHARFGRLDNVGARIKVGNKSDITVRHLFAHTSGLPPEARCRNDKRTTLERCTSEIARMKFRAAPGEEFFYGGVSMHVGGRKLYPEVTTLWPYIEINE